MRRLNRQELIQRTTKRLEQHLQANKVKDILGFEGYTFTMSLYGVIINYDTKHPEYRRIEVFMKGSPTQEDVLLIKHFFDELTPYQVYSIWAYDKKLRQILNIDGWD